MCFIIDVFSRMIVGWRCASHMRTEMVLDAIEMARWGRGTQHADLRCHSDAGSQFTSIRYGERLAEIGATPSIGTVGDSYDNALAETVNGYYKTELVRGPARSGPWRTVEDLELATLGWVHWHNTQRLDGYLGDVPPVEFEETFYAGHTTAAPLVGIKERESPSDPGRFSIVLALLAVIAAFVFGFIIGSATSSTTAAGGASSDSGFSSSSESGAGTPENGGGNSSGGKGDPVASDGIVLTVTDVTEGPSIDYLERGVSAEAAATELLDATEGGKFVTVTTTVENTGTQA